MAYNAVTLIAKHSSLILTTIDSHEFIAARDTKCKRKGVACSVFALKEDGNGKLFKMVVSINGPAGEKSICKNIVGKCGCVHAEMRAILFLALNNCLQKGVDYLLLTTYSPCTNCANLIVTSGFTGFVVFKYLTEHDQDGIAILASAGINVIPHSDLAAIDKVTDDSTSEERETGSDNGGTTGS